MASISKINIMTVGELIDAAFGEYDTNVVHHKLIQAVLYLMARQLRVLQRRVHVNLDTDIEEFPTTLSVTEFKLHAKKKKKGGKSSDSDKSTPQTESRAPSDKTSTSKKSGKTDTETKTTTFEGTDKKPLKSKTGKGPQEYAEILNEFELQRERELRIIRQRHDSREEQHGKQPTPMVSLDSVEATYEKLLVVERVPADEAMARAAREKSGTRSTSDTSLPIVTQEEFLELVYTVRQLQKKLGAVDGTLELPERFQLMLELRKGASLTDAMAALQLSARLEATEKAIQQLLSIVTELAISSGINVDGEKDLQVIFTGPGEKGQPQVQKSKPKIKPPAPGADDTKKPKVRKSKAAAVEDEAPGEEVDLAECVTYGELNSALEEMYDTIMNEVNDETARNASSVDNALKIARRLEARLEASMNFGDKMTNLETTVATYAERINVLDIGLSSQMSNYQEELTQMQHDLETGLENMAEALANTGGDATAVAELNMHFNELQHAIDGAMLKQKELRELQEDLSLDLDALRIQIEVLRDTKADREEVADALRDKAGLGDLNGMVSLQQFDAVRGDQEQRIGVAYNKFNQQEMVWQKVIDDLLREINDKADYLQVIYLRDEVNQYLDKLNKQINFMMDIVGEPNAAGLARKINRNAACLSCSTPAHMNIEEPDVLPNLPALRPPALGAEDQTPQEDGDHKPCYPGFQIPHPRDPRSHACNRWCGGSHTTLAKTLSRVPPGMIITTPMRKLTQELGTDGRMYAVDVPVEKSPCSRCNTTQTKHTTSSTFQGTPDYGDDGISGMTPPDYRQTFASMVTGSSVTPTQVFDEH